MSKRKIKDGQEERGGTAFRRAMIAVGCIAAAAALIYLAGTFFLLATITGEPGLMVRITASVPRNR